MENIQSYLITVPALAELGSALSQLALFDISFVTCYLICMLAASDWSKFNQLKQLDFFARGYNCGFNADPYFLSDGEASRL